jgi:hypothetical protein
MRAETTTTSPAVRKLSATGGTQQGQTPIERAMAKVVLVVCGVLLSAKVVLVVCAVLLSWCKTLRCKTGLEVGLPDTSLCNALEDQDGLPAQCFKSPDDLYRARS